MLRMLKCLSNKRANVIGTVLLAIMMLVSVGVYTNYQLKAPDKPEDKGIFLESELTTKRSLVLGIGDFVQTDTLGSEGRLWYCNYPYPASGAQINRTLVEYLNSSLNVFLAKLQEKSEQFKVISGPEIRLSGNMSDIFSLDNDSVSIDLDDFIIELNDGNSVRRINLSEREVFYFRLWYIYKGLYQWMEEDAGGLTQSIYTNVFDIENKPCQAYACLCIYEGGDIIPDAYVDELKVYEEDVWEALQQSVDRLNKIFDNSGISCSYNIDDIDIINHLKRNKSYTKFCDDREIHVVHNWSGAGPVDYLYSVKGYPFKSECNKNNNLSTTIRFGVIAINKTDGNTFNFDYNVNKSIDLPFDWEYNGTKAIEKAAMSSAINMVFDVECTDSEINIDTASGFKPFTTKISLGLNLGRNCDFSPGNPYSSNTCEFTGSVKKECRPGQPPPRPEGIAGHCKTWYKVNCSEPVGGVSYCDCPWYDCRCNMTQPYCFLCDESTNWDCVVIRAREETKPNITLDANCRFKDQCYAANVTIRLLAGLPVEQACARDWKIKCKGEGGGGGGGTGTPCDLDKLTLNDTCGRELNLFGLDRDCLSIKCVGSEASCFYDEDFVIDDEDTTREVCSIASGKYYNESSHKALFCNRVSCNEKLCTPFNEDVTISGTGSDEIKYTYCSPCQKAVCAADGTIKCVDETDRVYEWTRAYQTNYITYSGETQTYDELKGEKCSEVVPGSSPDDYFHCRQLTCDQGELKCLPQNDHVWQYDNDHNNYLLYSGEDKTQDELKGEKCSEVVPGSSPDDYFYCRQLNCVSGNLSCIPQSNHNWDVNPYHYNYVHSDIVNNPMSYEELLRETCAAEGFADVNRTPDGYHINCYKLQCMDGELNCTYNNGQKYNYSKTHIYSGIDYWHTSYIYDYRHEMAVLKKEIHSEIKINRQVLDQLVRFNMEWVDYMKKRFGKVQTPVPNK